MLQPSKYRFDPLDWIAAFSTERAARTLRALSGTVYLLLSLLAAMQILSPGAVQRIAAQAPGEVLLLALAGLLLLLGAMAASSVAMGAPHEAPHPGASDALLHFALAVAGFDLALGLLPATLGSIVMGGLGLSLLGCGVGLLLSGALPGGDPNQNTQDTRRQRAVQRRDHVVRGLVLAVLGAFLFEAVAGSAPGKAIGFASTPWEMPLLAATGMALLAYGLNTLSLLRKDAPI